MPKPMVNTFRMTPKPVGSYYTAKQIISDGGHETSLSILANAGLTLVAVYLQQAQAQGRLEAALDTIFKASGRTRPMEAKKAA